MQAWKPYEYCASRLEQRGWHPPRPEYTDALVEAAVKGGVEAIIHSAVSQAGVPLFPSRVFPASHPQASLAALQHLIERLHAAGRPVLSWYALNHSQAITTAHPDWRMVPITGPGVAELHDPAHDFGCCPNSPYGELLPEFCREIVADVGYDGIWFDGNTFAMGGNSVPGCVCQFCQDRFRRDTGRPLPTRIDWASADFRLWVNWRYRCLRELHERILSTVHAVKPHATIAFNNYRRYRTCGWETGLPLCKLGWDALMSGELDLQVFHGDFQMKMHRAYGCHRGQDSWMALTDHWALWIPDADPLPVQQAAVACAAAGGVMWMGCGFDTRLNLPLVQAAADATGPLLPHLGGEPVEHVAIWVSQQTQDFYHQTAPLRAWQEWHGANELCLQAHVQSSIVFDDHVADGDIVGHYPVLVAGNTACVSAAQAANLQRYVEGGGVLIACADFATRDELGWPVAQPLLDEFLGVQSRRPGQHTAVLELLDQELAAVCGRWLSMQHTSHVVAEPTREVTLLAHVVEHESGEWDELEHQGTPRPRHPGAWVVRRGEGAVIYIGANLFQAQIVAPTVARVRFFRALLGRWAVPAITLDAPLQVTMNVRARGDGAWVVHLHNAPGSIWRYGGTCNSGELVPVHHLRLRLRVGRIVRACSGLNGTAFAISDDGHSVEVPTVHRNEVVLLYRA